GEESPLQLDGGSTQLMRQAGPFLGELHARCPAIPRVGHALDELSRFQCIQNGDEVPGIDTDELAQPLLRSCALISRRQQRAKNALVWPAKVPPADMLHPLAA